MRTNDSRNIFIYIVLYLLIAIAFFSKYFVKEGEISTGAILIFIFGILSLIALTIIYTEKRKRIWAYFSITPFILIILINVGLLYCNALKIENCVSFWGFLSLLNEMIHSTSIIFICFIMYHFLLIILLVKVIKQAKEIKQARENKQKKVSIRKS